MIRSFAVSGAFVLHLMAAPVAAGDEEAGLALFRERIEPLLKAECFGCHSAAAKELKGGLRLDSRAGAEGGRHWPGGRSSQTGWTASFCKHFGMKTATKCPPRSRNCLTR